MREVRISSIVRSKITELESYLINDLKLSETAALSRSNRMRDFVRSLSNNVDYPLCRFYKWRKLGYRCAILEKDWVFAYEIFEHGIIVRDMSHTSILVS